MSESNVYLGNGIGENGERSNYDCFRLPLMLPVGPVEPRPVNIVIGDDVEYCPFDSGYAVPVVIEREHRGTGHISYVLDDTAIVACVDMATAKQYSALNDARRVVNEWRAMDGDRYAYNLRTTTVKLPKNWAAIANRVIVRQKRAMQK